MKQQTKGPFSYQNWKAALMGEPWQEMFEYPLFTDADIIGEITEGFGPYQVINTVPMSLNTKLNFPTLILRIQDHQEYKLPPMDKTQDANYHGGSEADEIAALISLCLGVRMKASGANRSFHKDGDPRGRPIAYWLYDKPTLSTSLAKPNRPILRSAMLSHSIDKAQICASLPRLSVKDAVALIRAARMYQEAIWIIEATPELSWIMLVSAIEVVADQWQSETETPVERMRDSRPNLESILKPFGGDELVLRVAEEIVPYMGATKKFVDFIIKFLPPPPPVRPPPYAQHTWEEKAMKKTMKQIYAYRSRALHGGHPFPAPMCEPPMNIGEQNETEEKPIGLATSMKGGVWVVEDTPILLHTYEYVVRNSILNWWKSLVGTTPGS